MCLINIHFFGMLGFDVGTSNFLNFQDTGYLLSPGDRAYDALGLMRQLNDYTATAMAEAQEVLASVNPDGDAPQNLSDQNSQFPDNELENLILLPPGALVCSLWPFQLLFQISADTNTII